MKSPHILLVDDDRELSDLLIEYLQSQDLVVTPVYEGKAALNAVTRQSYDLMVLDIMMPEIDGLTVLKQLPVDIVLPVIMLTAKGDDIDRIIGLELGADDYLGKPCNPRELLARINAVLKRSQRQETDLNRVAQPKKLPDKLPDKLSNSLFTLDMDKRRCRVGEELLTLTGTEFDLLSVLLKNQGQPVDKATLSQEVLQRELLPFDRSLDVHISRLRKKLSAYHNEPIQAIRGKGYQLTV